FVPLTLTASCHKIGCIIRAIVYTSHGTQPDNLAPSSISLIMPATSTVPYHPLTETIAWIARGLVAILLLIAPWPYAMAEWNSQLWLVPVVGAIFLLASLVAISRRLSVGNPMVWSLAAVLAVGLLQVTPLPESLWQMLSPAAGFEQ